MATYGHTFTSGDTLTPTKLNAARTATDIVNADISASAAIALSKLATGALPTAITVASANLVDGTIVNADINASAAIVDTKLATIATAGKVANTATTATNANSASAIVARDASGNFTAGTITAALTGNVTGNSSTATTLATGRTIALTGDVTYTSPSFNGSANVTAASTIANNAVTTAKILDANVTTAKIADANVTTAKIADSAVTSAKIADGTIVNADINASAAIALTKLASITAGQVLLGNASNAPTATALTGDVTINSSGVTAIGSGVIVNADINASAAIALSKLATGALPTAITVASANLVDGTIVNADINASAAIAGTKIAPDFGSQNISTTGTLTAAAGSQITTSGSGNTLELVNTSSGTPLMAITAWRNGVSVGGILSFNRAEGGTPNVHTVVDSSDVLGTIFFTGSDGTNFIQAASISSRCDGTAGTNDMPGRLMFSTTADGADTVTERMRIDSAGNVGIGTAAPSSRLHVDGDLSFSNTTTTVTATAGTAGDVPAQVRGYLVVSINGNSRRIPFYNA
jgi:hypothetical protein